MEYIIPKRTLRLWQIRVAVVGLILLAICIMLTKSKETLAIWLAVIVGISCGIIFGYLPKLFKNCQCRVVNNTVILKTGVFIRNIHVFPLLRLIYTQTFTTPLAAKMGLTCISLKAARNRIFIPELFNADAENLLNTLTRGGKDEI